MSLASIGHPADATNPAWGGPGRSWTLPAAAFFGLALPLSLLPPAMLVYAAAGHPLGSTAADAPWDRIAVAFFLAEIVAVVGMGWLVKRIGARYRIDIASYDAHLLAAVCPVPMWLSSLALLVGNLAISLVIGLAGLWLSEVLAYRRSRALCQGKEEAVATGFAASVVSAGLVAWALLLMLVAVLA